MFSLVKEVVINLEMRTHSNMLFKQTCHVICMPQSSENQSIQIQYKTLSILQEVNPYVIETHCGYIYFHKYVITILTMAHFLLFCLDLLHVIGKLPSHSLR